MYSRVFNAHFSFSVSKFGDVPWVDTELNLNFATQWLFDDLGDGGDPGRLDRWDTLLVKSRVCLFKGTWRKYHGGSNTDMWLQETADAAQELMEDGPHTLYPTGDPENDYQAIHKITDDLTEVPEVMYWRRYELGVFTNHVQSYHRSYIGFFH